MSDEMKNLRWSSERTTRRSALRRFLSAGVIGTAVAGFSDLLASPPSAQAASTQLPATMVLNALPPDAPAALRAAIEAQCCISYIRDEHQCGSESCGAGECCYHIVSNDCGLDYVTCLAVSCAEGNFTTGC